MTIPRDIIDFEHPHVEDYESDWHTCCLQIQVMKGGKVQDSAQVSIDYDGIQDPAPFIRVRSDEFKESLEDLLDGFVSNEKLKRGLSVRWWRVLTLDNEMIEENELVLTAWSSDYVWFEVKEQ